MKLVPSENLRAGIVGFGLMGKIHAQAYVDSGCAEVVAISNRSDIKMVEYLDKNPSCRSYSDWRAMLEIENLDVLSVTTYSPSHYDIVLHGVESGISRIFCEKPLATRIDDAQAMIDACNQQAVRLVVNHTRRWSLSHVRLSELLRAGIIGEVRGIVCSLGGGRLGCNGSHMFDLMRLYTNSEPKWGIGFIDQTGTPNPRGNEFNDPGGYGQIHFQNGARGYLDLSEDLGIPARFEVIGSMGRATVDEGLNRWDVITRSAEDQAAPLTAYGLPLEPYQFGTYPTLDILSDASRAIKELCGEKEVSCSGEDGKASLEMVMAFHLSHEQANTRIEFPLKGEQLSLELQIT